MTIIDSHVHFWEYDPVRDAWITDQMKVIQRHFSPLDAVKVFDPNGVTGCIAVQADESDTETAFLLNLSENHEFIQGVVGWMDLAEKNASEKLATYSRLPTLKGFRNIIQGQPDERYFLNKAFREGMKLLHPLGYTYDLLVYHDQLPQAIAFTGRYPDQRFMLDHIAKPDIRNRQWKKWKEDIREICRNPNVYCKVSGLVTEADMKQWRYQDLLPYLEIVAEHFGMDRLCYGSDWPVALLAGTYEEVLGVMRRFSLQVSEEERDKLFRSNTTRFYNLT
jgi:L-fuconolactonase